MMSRITGIPTEGSPVSRFPSKAVSPKDVRRERFQLHVMPVALFIFLLLGTWVDGNLIRGDRGLIEQRSIDLTNSFSGSPIDRITNLINGACTEIILCAYKLTNTRVYNSLKRASIIRGVNVTILVDDHQSKLDPRQKLILMKLARIPGIKIILWKNSRYQKLHAKLIIIDNITALIGSNNYDKNSDRNMEIMVTIHDRVLVKKTKNMFYDMCANAS